MSRQVKKSKAEIATIDCSLITLLSDDGSEFGIETANKIGVEPQITNEDATTLIIKGKLIAQKPAKSTLTGHQLTLTDNVFNPEMALLLQGGRIVYDPVDTDVIVGYDPPVSGDSDTGSPFELKAYSAQYTGSGQIKQYECITYPNCTGVPIAFGSEDGSFRAPEYTINSAPETGERPYSITYVSALPVLVDAFMLGVLEAVSVAGTTIGTTKLTVSPVKEVYTNKYLYKTDAATITLPLYGAVVSGYTEWDGVADITVATGQYLAIVEVDKDNKALSGDVVTVVSKA